MQQFNMLSASARPGESYNVEVTCNLETEHPNVRVWKDNKFFIRFTYYAATFKQLDENENGEMQRLNQTVHSISKTIS